MIKQTKKFLWALMPLLFVLSACQQVPLPGEGGTNPDPITQIVQGECKQCVKPCADGTLNCYFDFDNDDVDEFVATISNDPATGYALCFSGCMATHASCAGMTLENATAPCYSAAQECNVGCSIFNESSDVFNSIAASDPILIPQPSKAVLVTIKGCYDSGESTVTFQGPSIRTQKLAIKGKYYTDKTHPKERVYIGRPLGVNGNCTASRRGKLSVVVKPWKESTIAVAGKDHEVIPFNDSIADEFNLVWKRPQTTAFQLPSELSEQVDFSQTGWSAYAMPIPNTVDFFGTLIPDFLPNYSHYHNGTPNLGQGVMMIYGAARESQHAQPDFTMVGFVRSRE